MDNSIERICVVGAGFMGSQIALYCASHGHDVWVYDHSPDALQKADLTFREILAHRSEQELLEEEPAEILARLHIIDSLHLAVSDADLVIESVPEKLVLKQRVFADLDALVPEHCILATNSSAICVSQLEPSVKLKERIVNMHFYPPIWQRPMVEIMGTDNTKPECIKQLRDFCCQLNLTPLMVSKESMGFIFNRVWHAIKRECLQLVDEGVCSFQDVDRAWMIATRSPIGPFGMMDMVGLDVVQDIELLYFEKSADPADAPCALLKEKIKRGELGIKVGRGFYQYPQPEFQRVDWLTGGDSSPKKP